MNKIDLKIPAGTDSVTLNLSREGGKPTLRNMLPSIYAPVELFVNDGFFDESGRETRFHVRLAAAEGESLLKRLERSCVLEGEILLELVPTVRVREPRACLINGTTCIEGGSVVELHVSWPTPDEED